MLGKLPQILAPVRGFPQFLPQGELVIHQFGSLSRIKSQRGKLPEPFGRRGSLARDPVPALLGQGGVERILAQAVDLIRPW